MTTLIAPLIASHAATLEQLSPAQALMNADAITRSLSMTAELYELDVVIPHEANVLVQAVWAARAPTAAPKEIARQAGLSESIGEVPRVDDVLKAQPMVVMKDVLARLLELFRDRTRVGLSLPSLPLLKRQLGGDLDEEWAEDLVAAVISFIGDHEPGFIFIHDEGEFPASALGIANHFGMEVIGPQVSPFSVQVVDGDAMETIDVEGDVRWLITRSEIPAEADPKQLAASFRRTREL